MIQLGIRSHLKNQLSRRRLRNIFEELREFTMIGESAFCDNLQLAEMAQAVPGCIVECGVWRGGMAAGICRILGPERTYFLFDSFEGLPPAQAIDGQAAIDYQTNKHSPHYHDNCTAPPEFATRAMNLVGSRSFHLKEGFFEKTLPSFVPSEPIALLRLDADWYESTMTCLQHLFDHIAPGGIIILDDYYTWDGCSRALHDFLSTRKATERVRTFGSVCYLVKQAPEAKSS
jgi:O-methyltransferase